MRHQLDHMRDTSVIYSSADLEWLRGTGFPFTLNGGEITLKVRFRMSYNPETDEYSINPDNDKILDKPWIYQGDEYAIRIRWPHDQPYPNCYEEGQRKILKHASKIHVVPGDVHVNKDSTLCLAPPQALDMRFKNGFSLEVFVEQFLIPYLFSQTHFRKTGDWPWPPAGHGASGPLEWYWQYEGDDLETATQLTAQHLIKSGGLTEAQVKELLKKRYKGHKPCLFHKEKEGRRIRDCCPEALYGLNKLITNRHMVALSQGLSN